MNDLAANVLGILKKNARLSEQEIADRLNVSRSDVVSAIMDLEGSGAILGYTAITAPTPNSREVHAMIEVQVQPERDEGFDRIANRLAKFSEVVSVHLMSGHYDLWLEVVGDSLQDVAYFVASKLSPQPGVKSTSTLFLLKKYKESGILLEKDEQYERLQVSP